jgi:hypothetical protein
MVLISAYRYFVIRNTFREVTLNPDKKQEKPIVKEKVFPV